MESEFNRIRDEVRELKSLGLPNYNLPFIIRTNASNIGLGAVLQQEEKGIRKPLGWASRKLTIAETRYGITEKEMLACFWAVKRFEYELKGRKFLIETDHNTLCEMRRKEHLQTIGYEDGSKS